MISKKHLATVDGFIQKGIDEGAIPLVNNISELKKIQKIILFRKI